MWVNLFYGTFNKDIFLFLQNCSKQYHYNVLTNIKLSYEKNNLLLLLVLLIALIPFNIKAQRKLSLDDGEYRKDVQVKMGELNPYEVLDTRIDNMRYWRKAAALGLTPIEPYHEVGLGQYKGNRINAKSVVRDDSPDVPVTKVNSTQSENSILSILMTLNTFFSQTTLHKIRSVSFMAQTISIHLTSDKPGGGSIQGAGGTNSGDPTTAINLNGRQFVGYIHSNGGQGGVSYSDNGTTWTPVICAYASGGGLLDKIICGLTTALQAPLLAICITHGLTFTGQTTTILK